ncbi:pseudouridine synthase [Candidatus Malacoplasma girerdii]|uniref:Pseudouridine synthase n=1 Tax=Candidatus Malacoplasma girerdii TaxID=1318617 RepID=A0A097SSZ9_9BACT|nr:pseudouridine synthase [Candidatus Malacoplasma girerdii]
MKILKANHNDANLRIDKFVRKVLPNAKLSEIYKLLRTKKIKVNQHKVNPTYRINLNDEIVFYLDENHFTKQLKPKTNAIDFKVVYEDNNLLIVFKPYGLVVHTDESGTTNTLINQVTNYLIDKNEFNPHEQNSFTPTLINRIDLNTAGLVIIAKNRMSSIILNEKMKTHEIRKFYLTKVYGIIDPKKATISAYLTRFNDKKNVLITPKIISKDSKQIITKYELKKHDHQTSLIEIELLTGRTHQIRAHMQYLGHPLVGEQKYSSAKFKKLSNYKHQRLIAYKIIFQFKSSANELEYLNNKEIKLSEQEVNKYL